MTKKVAQEAAAWVARLHGPDRSRTMELECLAWQARSAANRYAFERCTDVWLEVPNAALAAGYKASPRRDPALEAARRRRRRLAWTGAVVLAVAVAAAVAVWALRKGGTSYATGVGEARSLMLEDGTRMFLNTDSRVRVDLRAAQRTVLVENGEVAFDVAKDAARPFVVRAGGSEVVALGTAFSVRLAQSGTQAGQSLAVTLLEGQVAVRPVAGVDQGAAHPREPVVMKPGDRISLAQAAGPAAAPTLQLDRPNLDNVLAWKRNEAVFVDTSLPVAVAEMNRYSRTPIVLADDLAGAGLQVSGRFRTGDNLAFAKALAAVHGLVIHDRQGGLELSRAL